jgi:hypothetical protein
VTAWGNSGATPTVRYAAPLGHLCRLLPSERKPHLERAGGEPNAAALVAPPAPKVSVSRPPVAH